MDCNTCKEKKAEPVSYIAFESMKSTMERTTKRLWVLALVLIILLFGTNAAWIYHENQFEPFTSTEVTQDVDTGSGDAAIAGIGDAYYGENTSNSKGN